MTSRLLRRRRTMIGAAVIAVFSMAAAAHAQPPSTPCATASYYSNKLKASFLLERMTIPGFRFWGARIVGMDADSPLHVLGLANGDVITRLDGVRVSRGRWWQAACGGYWMLPQMERHYGRTEVRHIISGTTTVRNGYVDLGPSPWPPSPSPGPVP